MNSYERETVEFLEVIVTLDGALTTAGIKTAVTTGERPTAWSPAVIVDGKAGLMVEGRSPGVYTVWAQVTAGAEIVALRVDQFRVA